MPEATRSPVRLSGLWVVLPANRRRDAAQATVGRGSGEEFEDVMTHTAEKRTHFNILQSEARRLNTQAASVASCASFVAARHLCWRRATKLARVAAALAKSGELARVMAALVKTGELVRVVAAWRRVRNWRGWPPR